MGRNVYATREWITTESIPNDPKDFIHQARAELEETIRKSLAYKGISD
jgi:hypothetical protein